MRQGVGPGRAAGHFISLVVGLRKGSASRGTDGEAGGSAVGRAA